MVRATDPAAGWRVAPPQPPRFQARSCLLLHERPFVMSSSSSQAKLPKSLARSLQAGLATSPPLRTLASSEPPGRGGFRRGVYGHPASSRLRPAPGPRSAPRTDDPADLVNSGSSRLVVTLVQLAHQRQTLKPEVHLAWPDVAQLGPAYVNLARVSARRLAATDNPA
jgi:hypothetical protein